ncbi:MAG TPA: alpha/beta hydrolase, partial [Burkholderiaceae bacterium]|jgi:pimeloyl-ACP methyl ester carboxylesterase
LFGRSFFSTPQGQAAAAATTAAIRSNDKDTYLEHLTAVLKFGRCEPGQDRSDTFTKRLSSIRKPTLLMVGEEDVLTVPAFSRLLAEGIQGAKLVVQPRAGHLNLIEQPEDSAQLILDFLSTL